MVYKKLVGFVTFLTLVLIDSLAHDTQSLDFGQPGNDQLTMKYQVDISSVACSSGTDHPSPDDEIYKRVVQCPVKEPPIKTNPTNPSPQSSEEKPTSNNPCFDRIVDQYLSCGGDEHGDPKFAPVIEWVENCVPGELPQ